MKLTFDESLYFRNKAWHANAQDFQIPGYAFPWAEGSVKQFFGAFGLDAYKHFLDYGSKEGVNPFPEIDRHHIYSKELFVQIQEVNDRTNNTLQYMTDQAHFGIPEWWCLPTDGKADCEGFSIDKDKKLTALGIRGDYVTCWAPNTEYHCVLIVRTDRGDLCLDNYTRELRFVGDTYHRWHIAAFPDGNWYYITQKNNKLIPGNKATPPAGWSAWRRRLGNKGKESW